MAPADPAAAIGAFALLAAIGLLLILIAAAVMRGDP